MAGRATEDLHVLSRLRRLIILVTAAGVVFVGAAVFWAHAVHVEPDAAPRHPMLEAWAGRFEAFLLHLGVLAGAAGLVLLLLWSWRTAILALAIAAAALVPLHVVESPAAPAAAGPALSVQAINLGIERADDDAVVAAIEAADAEVVLLLELSRARHERIWPRLEARFPAAEAKHRTDSFGLGVFARRPWTSIEWFHLSDVRTPQVRLTMGTPGGDVALYGIHILPPKRTLYASHRQEFVNLLDRIEAERLPTILAGDFNFVDHGALAKALHARGFLNAHAAVGEGRSATWPDHDVFRHVPGIRIDHVYAGRGLTVTQARVGAPTGSDHRPIDATVAWAREASTGNDANGSDR